MPRVLRAFLAAVVLVLLAPTTAVADRWTGADEAGDVEGSTWTPDPEPCGTDTEIDGSAETNNDITRLSVQHTRSSVVITTGFRTLKKGREQFEMLYLRTNLGGWWIDADRFRTRRGFGTGASLMVEPVLPDPEDIESECGVVAIVIEGKRCRVAREFDFARDRIRVVVPRACLGNPRWVRVGAGAYGWIEPEDPNDPTETSYHDHWDGGTELSPWAPPYGPRVPATAGARMGRTGTDTSHDEERHFVVGRDGIFARR